ncbi:uncharacterized protein LOC114286757 isoform X2 [Camellia sinensis]|uniref:uncharacterized protein LOC114286757 isoform X2 n=1 Tax=Camellia sinensis TaxID=4442 RepID=UPI001036C56B|nr:uncharacterized protein LOC114286757 isoform X2 [Camellia sinensis]
MQHYVFQCLKKLRIDVSKVVTVIFVGFNFTSLCSMVSARGPNFGSQGKIVLTSENSSSFKVGVRFDKPIPEGQDLGGLCEAGHGLFCNASELQPESTTLKDLQKSINNILLEECYCGKQEKEKFLVTTSLLSELFPNKITIDMPKDETHKAVLKRQFANDFEFLKSRGKLYVP